MVTKTRRGFTLIEMVTVILIISILAVIGVGFGSKQISNAKKDAVVSNLKIVTSEIEEAITEYGFLTATDVGARAKVKKYFKLWDKEYLSCPLNLDSVVIEDAGGAYGPDFTGAMLETSGYLDSYGHELRLYYLAPVTGDSYRIIVASAGPNGKFADDAANGYINDAFDDDIAIIMQPRK